MMKNIIQIDKIYDILGQHFVTYQTPVVDLVEAQTHDPFKILVTTILSARTKDETTTAVVKKLFKSVDKAVDFRRFSVEEIEKLIFPVGFYHQKAKYLKELPDALERLFQGAIPDEIDDLCRLPGVGRKTANLVRAIAFKKPAICVDVHVHRISNRLGYVNTSTPFETEMALREILPEQYWLNINSYLVAFGQNHCRPINPKCSTCPIYEYCQRIGVKTKYQREEQ
jgi:endonuclease III